MSSGASNIPVKGGVDPCWEYGERVGTGTSKVKCKFCQKVLNGGITRLKQHLGCIRGNATGCPSVPEDVKMKVNEIVVKFNKSKESKGIEYQQCLDDVRIGEEEMSMDDVTCGASSSQKSVALNKGPIDKFTTKTSGETAAGFAKSKGTRIDASLKKKEREDVIRYIGKWFFEAGIAFNAVTFTSFQQMLHAIGKFGPYLESPTPYELREKCLEKEVEETRESLKSFNQSCSIYGCSLMTDAWSDRKQRSIMNIVAHSSAGLAFLDSEDVSSERHTGMQIYNFVDKAIEDIGEQNVVQIVTDNASNNMAAASLLATKRPSIFWTSCAAHTVNLMLADIAKIRPIHSTITMGKVMTAFIYDHTITLSMVRTLIGRDIVRHGASRFALLFCH